MRGYSDKTCDRAIGSVDKEWIRMAKLALMIRASNSDPKWADEQEKQFTGIYKRLLTDPIEFVQQQARR